MRLFEHPDFGQAIPQAVSALSHPWAPPGAGREGLHVTEALRIIARTCGDKVIFKGGTSLSKGWNLIQRFSEDIDIFLDPCAFEAVLGKRAIDRELKNLRDAIARHPALTFSEKESHTVGGFGRSDRFAYDQRFAAPGEVAGHVLVEAGTASGREPLAVIELRSYLAEFLGQRGLSLGAEDEGSFSMRVLHFRRTFVEKLFAIHGKVELFTRDGRPIGPYARHYYDLFQLAAQPEVTAMLAGDEYAAIKADYEAVSLAHFRQSYFRPEGMRFSGSQAFFPPPDLASAIGAEYEAQCRQLCLGPYPSWAEVLARFEQLRRVL